MKIRQNLRRSDKDTGPAWWNMGLAKVAFKRCADNFACGLKSVYGDNFTIALFERALRELAGRADLGEVVFLPPDILQKHSEYVCRKAAMIEEQNKFRQSFSLQPVEIQVVATSTDELFALPRVQLTDHPTPMIDATVKRLPPGKREGGKGSKNPSNRKRALKSAAPRR